MFDNCHKFCRPDPQKDTVFGRDQIQLAIFVENGRQITDKPPWGDFRHQKRFAVFCRPIQSSQPLDT